MSKIIYTKELLEDVVKKSKTMRQVLGILGLTYSGGNYTHIKKKIIEYQIDFSHFTLKGNKKIPTKKIPPEKYLIKNSNIGSDRIKKRMIRDGIKEHKCDICGNTEWMGKLIPLELHHKDGDRTNNEIENLEFHCPNCHAQTDNYCSKNIKSDNKKKRTNIKTCVMCNKAITKNSKLCLCQDCYKIYQRKQERPVYKELIKDINTIGYSATGRKYGVSDNTIRKWIKFYKNTMGM